MAFCAKSKEVFVSFSLRFSAHSGIVLRPIAKFRSGMLRHLEAIVAVFGIDIVTNDGMAGGADTIAVDRALYAEEGRIAGQLGYRHIVL